MISLKDAKVGDIFHVESIEVPDNELGLLTLIGISTDTDINIIGDGYLEGTFVVSTSNDFVIQVNRNWMSKIKGSIVKIKKLVK